ncbi:MAG: tetratricopeptide repeat protein [bacterium]
MNHRIWHLLISLLLVLATYLAFAQVLGCGFVNFDDDQFVTANHHVRAGLTFQGIKWAFTTRHGGNCNPLAWLSHMMDCQLYGLNPGGHHLTSLLLHLLNTLLLFWVLNLATGSLWPSALVAALFALHPLHVESVAWIAERKDVLSTFFWMLTLGAWVRYVRRPALGRYLSVFLLFCLGLLAKPMLVSLPFVLLLLDYWPLHRFQTTGMPRSLIRLLLEKVPLLAFSAFWSLLTLSAQHQAGAVASLEAIPFTARLINAVVSYGSYLARVFWPHNLAVFYPHPVTWPLWHVAASGLLLAGLTALAIGTVRNHPCLIVGWLWYLGTLVPVIGLVQVGRQGMADRYTYVPVIGLFIMAAWTIPGLLSAWRYRRVFLASSAAGVLVVLMIFTWRQTGYWKSSFTLFQHALEVTADNYLAHYNLGVALADAGRYEEAAIHYIAATRIKPDYACAHNNLGIVLTRQEKLTEAETHYREALRIKPDWDKAHYNLGVVLATQGKFEEAKAHYARALQLNPGYARAHYSLGIILSREGKEQEAAIHYARARELEATRRGSTIGAGQGQGA